MVLLSRYSGLYEGGAWYALPKAEAGWMWSDAYTEYVFGDDEDGIDFWLSDEAKLIGRGNTPNGAVLDLLERHFGVGQWDYDDTREPFRKPTRESTREPAREYPEGTNTENGETSS